MVPSSPKTSLYHLQINISDPKKSLPFYKIFFAYFDYKVIDESPEHMGVSNGTTDFWLIATEKGHQKQKYHRKATGLNHLCWKVDSKEEVNNFVRDFLKKRKIPTLYDTPKHFHEYGPGYYAVFFEDPDRIKLEVTYKPEKDYMGTLVEESLEDNRVINTLNVLAVRLSDESNPKDRWHLHTVKISADAIKNIAISLKKGWYAHFWRGNEIIAVFKDKTFTLDVKDKKTWKHAIDYGVSVGIPKKQLDFKIE